MEILFLFLPAIIFLGLITSYEDIKFGKIRNKYIIGGILISLAIYIVTILYNLLTSGSIDYSYFLFFLVNILISLVLAVILWLNGIWSAADAKLFVMFTMLLPLSIYNLPPNKLFPSIFLLINCFVPYFFYLSFKGLLFTANKDKIKVLKRIKLASLIEMFLAFFAISWIMKFLTSDMLLRFAITIIVYIIFEKVAKAKITTKIKILLIFAIVRIFFDIKTILIYDFWAKFLLFFCIFTGFNVFMLPLVRKAIIHDLPVGKLKEGMLLAEIIERKKGRYVKSADAKKSFIELNTEGLAKKDIEKIRKTGIKKIKIFETIYFAPFIFIGVIITIIERGNLLNLLFEKPSYLFPLALNFLFIGIIFIWYIKSKKYNKKLLKNKR